MPRPFSAVGLFLVLFLWSTPAAFAGSESGRVTLPPEVGRSPDVELHLFQAGNPLAPRKPTDQIGKGLRSELALWIGGNRLAGSTLAWLTDTDSRTDSNGVWSGRNLPGVAVGILAWEPASTDRSQELAGEATGVPFPWPELVEMRAVE